jgi:outer membrane protein TolC
VGASATPLGGSATRLALALAVMMTGCMVGPKYVKPTVPMAKAPDAYKELDPNWKPATPADTVLKGDWWTLFNEPVLNDLEAKVASANQSLKVSEARFREARAQIRINRANLYPTIGTCAFGRGRTLRGRPTLLQRGIGQ